MSHQKPVALVTGANRGIGFEISRELAQKGFTVLMASRDPQKGELASTTFRKDGLDVVAMKLDIAAPSDIDSMETQIRKRFGRLDALVNNAGVFLDGKFQGSSSTAAWDVPGEIVRETFETNTLGAFLLCQKLIPLMFSKGGRVVNISSGMGQLSEMSAGYPAYRISKTALNAVTKVFAAETHGKNIYVNSVCPGWVKTDMGGEAAHRSVTQGAETPVWLATEVKETGFFWRDKAKIPW